MKTKFQKTQQYRAISDEISFIYKDKKSAKAKFESYADGLFTYLYKRGASVKDEFIFQLKDVKTILLDKIEIKDILSLDVSFFQHAIYGPSGKISVNHKNGKFKVDKNLVQLGFRDWSDSLANNE